MLSSQLSAREVSAEAGCCCRGGPERGKEVTVAELPVTNSPFLFSAHSLQPIQGRRGCLGKLRQVGEAAEWTGISQGPPSCCNGAKGVC